MVKKYMPFLSPLLFLLVMALVTVGGKALFSATRTVVQVVLPEAYREEVSVFVAVTEDIEISTADAESTSLSFAFDAQVYPIHEGIRCNVILTGADTPIQAQVAEITQDGAQSTAHVILAADILPPGKTVSMAIIALPPPVDAHKWFRLPASAVTNESVVYVLVTEQGYFTERSTVRAVPVDVWEAEDETHVLVSGGIGIMDLVVIDAAAIDSDGQKIRLQ